MTNDDLCHHSATDALQLFRKRKLSPRELLRAIIARSEKIDPAINCFAGLGERETLIRDAFGTAAYARLQQVKKKFDLHNVFR